ncbi:MAG: cyclic nucleotide-binding domain-containing protein [Myxococcales bacterium]|nr:cyclic nucleotide-binding domain-containing protein [Myxococcales bacterium]
MSDDVIERLAAIAELVSLGPGAVIIREGEVASDLYALLSGALVVTRRRDGAEIVVDRVVDEPILLGEMQVLTGGRRVATVRAESACQLLRIGRPQLEATANEHPALFAYFAELARDRLRRHQLQAALGDEATSQDESLLLDLCDVVDWQTVDAGAQLVRQGEESDAIYFLLSGRLLCVVEDEDAQRSPVVLDEILPGESLGESAALRGRTRAASVWATRPSEVARVDQAAFLRVSQAHPSLMRRTLEVVVERQRSRRRGTSARTIAIIPLREGVPMREFMDALTPELSRLTAAVHLDRRALARRLGDDALADLDSADPRALRVTTLMDELESEAKRVVYEVDRLDSGWARRCLLSADELVLVGLATQDPTPSALERRLTGIEGGVLRPHTTLVLLHPIGHEPKDTRRWLADRQVDGVHHVGVARRADHARLARFLAGAAVGLVLSGGAARGLAGFGVIRAMHELGIPIDAIGGVSSGALVAAGHAAGLAPDTMIDMMRAPRSMLRMIELNPPVVSLSSARGLNAILHELFGARQIEDLWIPALFVSTNMTRARQRVSARGDLREALMASNSMPGVFPPVVIDGDLHVDGAFLNNVPIAELRRLVRGGPVIALDVTPSVEFEHNLHASAGLSGWSVVKDRLLGRGDHSSMPNMIELLLRSALLHHVAHLREVKPLASLYLSPDLKEFGLMQHIRVRAIAQAGYERTREALEAWWATAGVAAPAGAPGRR